MQVKCQWQNRLWDTSQALTSGSLKATLPEDRLFHSYSPKSSSEDGGNSYLGTAETLVLC